MKDEWKKRSEGAEKVSFICMRTEDKAQWCLDSEFLNLKCSFPVFAVLFRAMRSPLSQD